MAEDEIGKITHYFSKIGVGVIKIENSSLSVGDRIHIKGHITDFEQDIESMQIEHEEVETAEEGQSIGLKVKQPVKSNDIVYKITE